MKRLLVSSSLLLITCASFAEDFPVQLESDRKPKIETHQNVLIQGGRVITVTHGTIEGGDLLIRNGKIAAIGKGLNPDPGMSVIDAKGKIVMPGIIDAHSHRASESTNEGSDSITAECRIFDVLNPTGKNIYFALASGETTGMILHGSANCVGGQSQVIKFKYGRPAEDLLFPGAPRMIKFALGENVTRSSDDLPPGQTQRFPRTRMGVQALYRRAFTEAREYIATWDRYEKDKVSGKRAVPPRTDMRLGTLADILRGKIWVQCHCYRADEMLMMVRLSQEFGFKIGALQHALEAYQIAPELAKAGIGVSIFANDWSFKPEGYDAIPYNMYLCTKAGVNVSVNTDSMGGTVALTQDAAKAMRYGGLTENEILRMITINPARELGIDKQAGSLEVGKDGDVSIWDGHPLSVYSRCTMTIIDGDVFFQRPDAFGVDKTAYVKSDLTPVTSAQPAELPAQAGYAIVGAKIHPVSGPVIPVGTVVIRGGKIAAVGANVAIPHDCYVVKGRGLNVYPGFIDAGSSLGLVEIPPIGQTIDEREGGQFQPDLIAATAVHRMSAHFPVARVNGITSTFTRPTGGAIPGQGSVINLDGFTREQMTLVPNAGLMLSLSGGGGGGFGQLDLCDGDEGLQSLDVDDMDRLRSLGFGDYGAFAQAPRPTTPSSAKDLQDYFDKAKAYYDKRAVDRTVPENLGYEAIKRYVRGALPVMIRARTAAQIRAAVTFITNNKLKGVLVGADDAWKEAKLLAEKSIPVILTPGGLSILSANLTVADYDPYDVPYAKAAVLAKAGVKFCFQSDDNAMAMNLPFRAAESVSYGLSREAALRSITLSAAEILGVSDQLGSVSVGKRANLVIASGDPMDCDGRVEYVFIDGKPVSRETKFTRLFKEFGARIPLAR